MTVAPSTPPDAVVLRRLTPDDEAQARLAQRELADDGFTFLLNEFTPDEPWAAYLERVAAQDRGLDLPEGKVASTFLVAQAQGRIVGRVSIRHELNDFLLRYGGHFGYGVRPAERRRGYATAILRQGLLHARGLGLDRVLVTCDDTNVGSATVIERCGGLLENIEPYPDSPDNPAKRRYWIALG